MMFESVGATPMALISDDGVVAPRIAVQVGVGKDAVVVRHRLLFPANSELWSLGSMINGAMKFSTPKESPEIISAALLVSPPFVERNTSMYWYSPYMYAGVVGSMATYPPSPTA